MILIDDRVGSKEIVPHLEPGINYELTRLDFADFAFVGQGPDGMVSIGIERKTIGDLLNSMESGRLSGYQLKGLIESYDYNYLIVEGFWQCDQVGNLNIRRGKRWTSHMFNRQQLPYSRFVGYLNTLTMLGNIHPVFLTTLTQTGHWTSKTYHWWQKLWHHHKSHLQFHVDPPARAHIIEPSLFRKMLKELDGVGWDRAEALEKHFANFNEILVGGVKEMCKVPGIGKVGAQKILKQLEEVY